MTLSAGARLGPYEIVAPLGSGGMGEVYRARDTRLNCEVAIKVLPAELASDASRLRRFEKEARSASGLNHPNIVTVYDIGSEAGVSYIAMEKVEGETLRKLLAGGAVPVKKLLPIGTQIAEGLAKAHEAGIVHRDLKPENVMVTKDGLVKILDFGLAKPTHVGSGSDEASHLPTETGTSPGMIVGTVGYMSPEQASGEAVDFRSDQFSFGSILYELATGKRAFLKKTGVDTLGAILNEDPQPIAAFNPQVPAPLRWIVERCHAKDPEGRYASTRDLARELRTLDIHLGEASTSGATGAVTRSSGIRRAGAMALAVFLAAALGIVGTKWIGGSGSGSVPETRIRQLTFRREGILSARFAPDGQTIVYSVATGRDAGKDEIVSTRVGSPESRSLGLPSALLQSISSSGELAVVLGMRPNRHVGTLASLALAGGAPREILENVYGADWAPDGRAMAVLHVVEGKKRLEFPIGRVLYEMSGRARGPAVSPKGDRIAITEGEELTLFDLSGKKQTLGTVQDFAWMPRGDEILFNELVRGATIFRAVSLDGRRRFLTTLPGDIVLQDVSREGSLLLERAAPEDEMIGRSSGDSEERNLSWLDGSIPVDLSADGKTVLFNETSQGGEGGAVYLRRTDGSAAVRLGAGAALALSPDGAWALCRGELGFALVPTGAGQPRTLPFTGLDVHAVGNFFPDSRNILLLASEAGHKARLLTYDTSSHEARPLTGEGIEATGDVLVSPDGRSALGSRSDGRWEIYDLSTGTSRLVVGVSADLYPIKWCSDSRSVFVRSKGDKPVAVSRLELATGRLTPWKEFSPTHVRRGNVIIGVIPAPDGKSYVYGYGRYSSDLFLLEGLK